MSKRTCRELVNLINSGMWGLTDAPNELAARVERVLALQLLLRSRRSVLSNDYMIGYNAALGAVRRTLDCRMRLRRVRMVSVTKS